MSSGGGNESGREKRGGWEKKRETAVQRGLVAAEVVLAQREDAAVLEVGLRHRVRVRDRDVPDACAQRKARLAHDARRIRGPAQAVHAAGGARGGRMGLRRRGRGGEGGRAPARTRFFAISLQRPVARRRRRRVPWRPRWVSSPHSRICRSYRLVSMSEGGAGGGAESPVISAGVETALPHHFLALRSLPALAFFLDRNSYPSLSRQCYG